MLAMAGQINAANLNYNMLEQNNNSAYRTILDYVGARSIHGGRAPGENNLHDEMRGGPQAPNFGQKFEVEDGFFKLSGEPFDLMIV